MNGTQFQMIQLLVSTFLWGVYTMVFGACICALCFVQAESPLRRRLLLVTLVLYTLCSCQAVMTFWQGFVSTDLTLAGTLPRHDSLLWYIVQGMADAFRAIATAVADGLLTWRCYILWRRQIPIIALPIILLLAGIACAVGVVIFDLKLYTLRLHMPPSSVVAPREWYQLSHEQDKLDIGFWLCTCSTNLLTNGLLAFRIWKITAGIGRKRNKYMRLMYVILETGMFYSICLFLSVVINIVTFDTGDVEQNSRQVAEQVLASILTQLVGIFPTVIILLVALGKSVEQSTDELGPAANNDAEKVSTIQFATPPARVQASDGTGGTQTIQLESRSDILTYSPAHGLEEV
ncbi:hypothetical protein OE88DRAFT_125935 [Heliocybe sulcata]|uniref:Uncharacterized protein n=1 Tax=Heliocybe sulcata TaxID=5364 RepID=A0A5C3NI11_9AGAM|nr:hypothetical protein OE88DRAFT_125935 [Heliocybe sulcata]